MFSLRILKKKRFTKMISKKQLAITLSRLQSFDRPSILLEQYPTDSEIAAEIIWHMQLSNDIQGNSIADLGCGTGVLGIGCSFFLPEKIYFVDKDERVLRKLKNNLQLFDIDNIEIITSDITQFNEKVDLVIQNPPFGTKNEHADKKFLEKAFSISKVVYSFHKLSTKNFVEAISRDNKFKITHMWKFDFPLKQVHEFHKRKIHRIEVGCWRFERE
jgi:putative methylase